MKLNKEYRYFKEWWDVVNKAVDYLEMTNEQLAYTAFLQGIKYNSTAKPSITNLSLSTAQRCPVCDGRGIVPHHFYSPNMQYGTASNFTDEICKSCRGTGII